MTDAATMDEPPAPSPLRQQPAGRQPVPPPALRQEEAVADWRAALPEALRDDPSLRDIRDVAALAKSYIHAQRLVGADKIAIPGRQASAEEWSAVFDRLGRPRSPDGYAFERPEEGALPYDETLERAFRDQAHALGLLPAQAQGLHRWWLQAMQDGLARQREAADAHRAEAESRLRDEWGGTYERQLENARLAVRRLADPELQAALSEGLGNDPRVIRFCARVGALLQEDRQRDHGPAAAGLRGAAEAKRQIAEVLADRNHPYFHRHDPRHEHAVEHMRGLFETAYGEVEE